MKPALTVGELRRREKSRHYSAAMRKRWKRIRDEQRAYRWEIGATPPTSDERAKIDEALGVGVLVMRELRTWRLRNLFYRACKAHDRPFAVITVHGTIATLEVDLVTHKGRREFTEESIKRADRLAYELFCATVSHRGRKWERHEDDGQLWTEVGSCGSEVLMIHNVPLDRASELMHALLALSTYEELPKGGMRVYDANCEVPDDD